MLIYSDCIQFAETRMAADFIMYAEWGKDKVLN